MPQISERLKAIIDQHVPEHMRPYMYRMVAKEGGDGTTSVTGAKGPLQFTKGTGKLYGLVGPQGDIRENEAENIKAGVRLTQDNANTLRRYLNRDPTNSELALAHQQGADTAGRMLTGTGNAPPRNLAVNKVDPNAPPQEAARQIMNYYGFGNNGLSLTGYPQGYVTPASAPTGAAPFISPVWPPVPGMSLASTPTPTQPAAPATFQERLLGTDLKGGKDTPFANLTEGLGDVAKGIRRPAADPRLNDITPSSSGIGVVQRIE